MSKQIETCVSKKKETPATRQITKNLGWGRGVGGVTKVLPHRPEGGSSAINVKSHTNPIKFSYVLLVCCAFGLAHGRKWLQVAASGQLGIDLGLMLD